MKRILLFICALLTSCLSMMAQGSLTVTGKVIDGTNNEPLIGVNVSIKNEPGLGAITDINGNSFALSGFLELLKIEENKTH